MRGGGEGGRHFKSKLQSTVQWLLPVVCFKKMFLFRVGDPEEGAGLRDPVLLPPGTGGQGPGGGHCPLSLYGHFHTGTFNHDGKICPGW